MTLICDSCKPGYNGNQCESRCLNCDQGTCAQSTGTCDLRCVDGFYTDTSSKPCLQPGCLSCQRQSGQCVTCKTGLYGTNCDLNCSAQCLPSNTGIISCNKTNGACLMAACKPGYYGNACFAATSLPELVQKAASTDGLDPCASASAIRPVPEVQSAARETACVATVALMVTMGTIVSTRARIPARIIRATGSQASARTVYRIARPSAATQCAPQQPLDSTNCLNGLCNRYTARCDACANDWWGANCASVCGNCMGDKCNQDTGACASGCDDGYYSLTCTTPCRYSGCQACDNLGECVSCKQGKYDTLCSLNCSDKCLPRAADGRVYCARENGQTWFGPSCDIRRPGAMPDIGNGYYAGGCNTPCLFANCDTCNKDSGQCSTCKTGFYGTRCDLSCSPNCAANINGVISCSKDLGLCDEQRCRPGYWDTTCTIQCSATCLRDSAGNRICQFSNGTCIVGCEDTYFGSECDSAVAQVCAPPRFSCLDTCNDNTCGRTSGVCDECNKLPQLQSALCRTAESVTKKTELALRRVSTDIMATCVGPVVIIWDARRVSVETGSVTYVSRDAGGPLVRRTAAPDVPPRLTGESTLRRAHRDSTISTVPRDATCTVGRMGTESGTATFSPEFVETAARPGSTATSVINLAEKTAREMCVSAPVSVSATLVAGLGSTDPLAASTVLQPVLTTLKVAELQTPLCRSAVPATVIRRSVTYVLPATGISPATADTTAVCLGDCNPGYYGETCNTSCPFPGAATCERLRGASVTCKPGLYGQNCLSNCSRNCVPSSGGQITCNKLSGSCDSQQCADGFYNPFCTGLCENTCLLRATSLPLQAFMSRCQNCDQGTCAQSTGTCDLRCVDGFYTDTCSKPCLQPGSDNVSRARRACTEPTVTSTLANQFAATSLPELVQKDASTDGLDPCASASAIRPVPEVQSAARETACVATVALMVTMGTIVSTRARIPARIIRATGSQASARTVYRIARPSAATQCAPQQPLDSTVTKLALRTVSTASATATLPDVTHAQTTGGAQTAPQYAETIRVPVRADACDNLGECVSCKQGKYDTLCSLNCSDKCLPRAADGRVYCARENGQTWFGPSCDIRRGSVAKGAMPDIGVQGAS
ncbi:hypothetical protein DPMN_038703 [Dreissena polymorpha]|uniref:EGF-like domain-containing protein n=1 Tax=Dreissena polymorpha TaxID=45954 RepID=A0A9D4MD89_DREPO|nr:hypothetical protein DPMN_038703 [Dreissena polymorpha]